MAVATTFRRRSAVSAAVLLAASAVYLRLAPRTACCTDPDASPAWARADVDVDGWAWVRADVAGEDAALAATDPGDGARRALLRPARSGEVIRYASDPRRKALAAALPCDAPGAVRWYDDIDYAQRALCGGRKCFFRSICDATRGYLVHAGEGAEDTDYDVAAGLEARHGIRHLFASPPFQWKAERHGFRDRLATEYADFYGDAAAMVVQPVLSAPEGSAIVRCYAPRMKYLIRGLDRVLRGADEAAMYRLVGGLKRAAEAVAAEPALINDYQLLVTPRGTAYHLDLERMQKGKPSRTSRAIFEGCLEDAIQFVRALKDHNEEAKARLQERIEQRELKVYGMKAKGWQHAWI